jgi:hypothetical protein
MSHDDNQTIQELQTSNMRLQEDRDRWRKLCLDLAEVVKNENRSPLKTGKLANKHRDEWPQLWIAIDNIVDAK